ncbi:MAG: Ig-like domain repeat protein, partial [Lachnospiraceae bacterium]|nr:Ig-like domain repeat protein [Lachnospiraceae bacterium]
YKEDGDYTFKLEVTDLAGNEADIFVPHQFTVDTTPPKLKVEGVKDGSANKGKVEPIITYSDINLEEDAVDIILKGSNRGKVDYEKKVTRENKEICVDLGDFKREKSVDDLYTLDTLVEDLAGNQTTDTRTFSVNRFGSVYVLSPATGKMVDDYYINKEQDMVITEINVDKLSFKEVDCSIDGEVITLEEGKDYEVNKSLTDAKWNSYEYHISKKNFEKEGAYVVTIYSEDRATNKSSNKAKEKEVSFVVDKTAPSIVVAGVENGGQYAQNTRDVTIDVQDNILLDNVEVYVDNALVKTEETDALLENNGITTVTLKGSNKRQLLKVSSRDAAGNRAYSPEIFFLITKNILIQWYSNKILFFGSIIAVLFVIGVFATRKKTPQRP